MPGFLVRRTARVPVTILAVATLAFGLMRFLPGEPLAQRRGELLASTDMTPAEVDATLDSTYNVHLSGPIYEQYVGFMTSLLQGDLGVSFGRGRPVTDIIAEALPWTIFLVVVALVLGFALGILLGSMQVYWEGSWFDKGTSAAVTVAASIPFYIYAIVFLFVFGFQLDWFPEQGYVGRTHAGELDLGWFLSVGYHSVLPITAFAIPAIATQALAMRSNGIQVLGKNYVRVARLRGIPDRQIATRYVSRNAILPLYTGLLLSIAFRLGGAVILEEMYSYPGVGRLMVQAMFGNDYPLLMGSFLVVTCGVIVAIYVADLTYSRIDPRIKERGSGEAY